MTIFEIFILNSIYVLFPILLYLFFFLRYTTMHKKINDLILDFCLVSSFYLLTRFGELESGLISILIFNVPLMFAYLNKRDISIGLLSLVIIYNYFNLNNSYFYFVLIEYLIYFVLYFKLINKEKLLFSVIFIIIKSISFFILGIGNIKISKIILYLILFCFLCFIVNYLFDKGKQLLNIRLTFKELEREKQIRTSLFKITHEIKNPIAVCKGYLDMFDVNNKTHSRKYIPIIKSEIERTLILLQDFLDCNHLKINKDILDINMLLEEVSATCMPIINSQKIKYIFKVDEEELYMEGDYERLKQVVINVLKNSIEAVDSKENSFISLYTKIKKNNIHIFIEDNGGGMNKEDLKRIKEPFYTTKKDGTGLGVTLSFEIIKAHNGNIIYKSEYGKGTTVEIILPILKEEITY